ncbi:hypothetical protein AVEN_139547-1 [Araneus ventricosus]|uniref:Uncharacterized protein n=1 Tax=Araneus ventricosus TaxID=182803 RepID=A0A4Y2MX39_ARAVE|nr:hypothetical protein AVEN_139547-1 [Araneus ventricosus]
MASGAGTRGGVLYHNRVRTPPEIPEKLLNFALFYPDISFCLLKNYNQRLLKNYKRAKDKIMIKHKNTFRFSLLIERRWNPEFLLLTLFSAERVYCACSESPQSGKTG